MSPSISQNGAIASVVLKPRSLIYFTGEAYSDYMHEILPVTEDIVGQVQGVSVPVLNIEVGHVCQKGFLRCINVSCNVSVSLCEYQSHQAQRWVRRLRGG